MREWIAFFSIQWFVSIIVSWLGCRNACCRLIHLLGAAALVANPIATVSAAIPMAERTTLSNLYAYTDGWYWAIPRGNWNRPPGTECAWYGITCDAEQSHVVAIDLTGLSLTGTLPSLSALSQLQSLKLTNNGHLGFNNLYGAIPELKALSHLQEVYLGSQHFSGAIPELAGLSELTTLYLDNQQLIGHLPALTGLHRLESLDVSNNQLDGQLPSFDDLTRLTYLRASSNFFSGSLPALDKMTSLQYFYLDDNQLSGSVSPLSGLMQLKEFWVLENQLDGVLPTSISGLPNLQTFSADINFLTGSVPALTDVLNLQQFGVAVNQLTGQPPIPPTNAGFKEFLCPNYLTPANDPPTSLDLALNQVAPVTPWSAPCTQTPIESLVRGTAYIDPATADGKTVTVKAVVYGKNPTGTVAITTLGFKIGSVPVTVCDNVPVINSFAICRFQASARDWAAQIGVTYSGDANNKPASYVIRSRVAAYQLSLSSSSASVQAGQSVDLVATVDAKIGTPAETGVDPTNTLSFYDGETVLCSHVPIDILGPAQTPNTPLKILPQITARCSVRFDTPGEHVLTVRDDNVLELGEPSPPLTQTVTSAVAFSGDQFALTGTWYNSATSGQGLLLEVFPDRSGSGVGELFGGWFTFDDLGNAQWRTLQGKMTATHGSSYLLTIYRSSGGNFNAPPTADAVVDGTATLTFHDCTHATLVYRFNDGRSGEVAQVRLTGALNCQTNVPPIDNVHSAPFGYSDVRYSGAWYDPQTSGQGLVLDVVPSQGTLFAAWYTYAPSSEGQTGAASQRWFTLQAEYTPGDISIKQVPIYSVIGGLFDKTTRTAGFAVGTADIMFTSCNAMTMSYQFTGGEFAGISGSVTERKVVPRSNCP